MSVLSDEQLREIAGWYDKTQTAASSMATELLALRAERAKLEAALETGIGDMVSVTDFLELLLDDGRFPPKGRGADDKDWLVGWWEVRYSAINRARASIRAFSASLERPQ